MIAHDIESVDVLSGYRLRLRFADGMEGIIDVREHIPFEGLFAPLADPSFFEQVAIYPELKTIYWPGDIDVCHDLLYQWVK
jgi:hypothetical protein